MRHERRTTEGNPPLRGREVGEGDDKPALIFMSAERAGEGFDWWPDFFLFFLLLVFLF